MKTEEGPFCHLQMSKPEHCNIHWDGKQLTSCLGVVDECEALWCQDLPPTLKERTDFVRGILRTTLGI